MSNNIIYLECNSDRYVDDSVNTKNGIYGLEDCVLIRTTDIFPFDKIVETPVHGNAYAFDSSEILEEAILEVLRKKYSDEEFLKEKKKYDVCFEIFRSTIHFCVNGLVSSHMYGNFEGRSYVIIEPLKYHINDNSLCSLNASDTYFNDDMQLSDEAVIMIQDEKFEEIKNDPTYCNQLNKFKVFVFKGNNQAEAVKKVLESLGYDYFSMNEHGYRNGLDNRLAAGKMWESLEQIRKIKNIEAISHFYSDIRIKDIENRDRVLKEKNLEYFYYILNNSVISNELLEIIREYEKRDFLSEIDFSAYLSNTYNVKDVMVRFVLEVGLDNLLRLTNEFNANYIEELKMRKNCRKK